MRKWRADDFWFELTEGPSPDGVGFVRYHEVSCRKCRTKSKTRQMGQANDQLRKFFIRQGWDIGRARNLHLCPDCAHKHKDLRTKPQPQPNVVPLHREMPPPPKRVTLMEAWEQADDIERTDFWNYLQDICAQHGEQLHVDPVEPPQPASQKNIDDFLREVKQAKTAPASDDPYWQHGTHIDSMPAEPVQPPSEHPVAMPGVETTPPSDDDDEPADWWQEIHGEKK